MEVVGRASERRFGALLAGYLELQSSELALPLVVCLVDFLNLSLPQIFSGVVESDHRYDSVLIRRASLRDFKNGAVYARNQTCSGECQQ